MDDEVTIWLDALVTGDDHAAPQIWNRYLHRTLAFVRKRLATSNRRVADEEDPAVSVP